MLSRWLLEALEAGAGAVPVVRQPIADTPTERTARGSTHCPDCFMPVSYLMYDDQGQLGGPPFEHRQHYRGGGLHQWPQPHHCEPDPDACLFCKGCDAC